MSHVAVQFVRSKTNDNDQAKETQGKTRGGHLLLWNAQRVKVGTEAPVRGQQRTKNTKYTP